MLQYYNFWGLNVNAMFKLTKKRFKQHLTYIAITPGNDKNEYEFIFEI